MYRIILFENKIYVFDKSEKEFRQKYGSNFEQLSSIKDQDNIDQACEKLLKQYKAEEIIKDCHIKKRFGWKYHSDEIKEKVSKNISIAMTRYKKTKEHGEAISRGKKGKPIKGHALSEHTKKLISFAKKGFDPIKGKKWMHNPLTGEEKRDYELKEGMVWGRSPEAKEYINYAMEGKRLKKLRSGN